MNKKNYRLATIISFASLLLGFCSILIWRSSIDGLSDPVVIIWLLPVLGVWLLAYALIVIFALEGKPQLIPGEKYSLVNYFGPDSQGDTKSVLMSAVGDNGLYEILVFKNLNFINDPELGDVYLAIDVAGDISLKLV